MTDAAQRFAEYASFHTDPRNRVCHEIGIPLIVLAILALLEPLKLGAVDLGLVVGALIAVYYFTVDVRSAWVALVALALLYVAGRFVPWPWAVGAFVAGWVFQFVGHGFEGKKPAFFTNVVHLLIGPLWICSLVTGVKTSG